MPEVESEFVALPAQTVFLRSEAKIRGYGGAMGGGKSRTLCEAAFDMLLDFPGIRLPIIRQSHVSLQETTKKTFLEQVLPPELRAVCRKKESQGEDWLELPNGSRVLFIGLDNPVRWFSSELGSAIFDEAHEIAEEDVVTINTRLRQKGMPHRMLLSFNPANPGHWLQQWFILGASQTRYGFCKTELWPSNASGPIGDCEFVFAKATDNPHLPPGYVEQQLGGLPEHLRRRYLEGIWEFITGTCYFDTEALTWYQSQVERPAWVGRTVGDVSGKNPRDKPRIEVRRDGPWSVWEAPVREHFNEATDKIVPAHRYVATVDVSSGAAADYSAIQVIDVEGFAQVAEFQAKLDTDLLAEEAIRIARVYNMALIVPEVTGGWGHSVVRAIERRGYPRIYMRKVEDRLSKKFTDKLGWDTNLATRAVMLDTLEEWLRKREFTLRGERTLLELTTFVRDEKGRPAAQPGCHDDLVVSLAMAVTIASQMPKQLRRPIQPVRQPRFARSGY